VQFLSDEEQQLLHNYILLPLTLRVFQRDMKVIAESPLKTKEPYLKLMDAVIQRVESDLIQVRKGLRAAGVKIYEERKTEDGISVKYSYKGYHHEGEYLWRILGFEVETVMERYLV
jgi:hypothetical protein